ncbi:MAG: hypothetical protein FJY42_14175, partial [Betaproteobacteria bacterium]|nr:hypothetical protein [Betaproteobacteria bacterium]
MLGAKCEDELWQLGKALDAARAPLRPASANDAVFTLPANDPLFAEPAAETIPPPEPLPPGWDCVGGVLGELMA